jgi:hypothetical protein
MENDFKVEMRPLEETNNVRVRETPPLQSPWSIGNYGRGTDIHIRNRN